MDGTILLNNTYDIMDCDGNYYGLEDLAVQNTFVELMTKVAYQMGSNLKPFCFYPNDLQKEWQVTDFSTGNGLCNFGYTLAKEIRTFHILNLMKTVGMLGDYPNITDKTVLIDYLLSISVCYIEIPKYVKRGDKMAKSYDKYIATKNIDLIAQWLGKEVYEIEGKYNVGTDAYDLVQNTVRLIKLTNRQNENKVSKPRDAVHTGDMSIFPLFMLNSFLDGVWEKLSKGIVKFTYSKDNGVVRELISTCNQDLLNKVYQDSGFVSKLLDGILLFEGEETRLCKKQDRGYIRIPEFGASRYDETGVRAVNINRILSLSELQITDVDLSYINVDLDNTLNAFKDGLRTVYSKDPSSMLEFYKEVMGKEPTDFGIETYLRCYEDIIHYVDATQVALTTQFNKSLHKFMITHQHWYPYYTGMPQNVRPTVSKNDFGVM